MQTCAQVFASAEVKDGNCEKPAGTNGGGLDRKWKEGKNGAGLFGQRLMGRTQKREKGAKAAVEGRDRFPREGPIAPVGGKKTVRTSGRDPP